MPSCVAKKNLNRLIFVREDRRVGEDAEAPWTQAVYSEMTTMVKYESSHDALKSA